MEYPWLENKASAISRDFLPEHYTKATSSYRLEKIIFVESGRVPEAYLQETDWIRQLALQENKIGGIVAFFPIEKGDDAGADLEKLASNPLVKGIRRMGNLNEIVQSRAYHQGLRLMQQHQLCLDIHYDARQMLAYLPVIDQFPELIFVVNHLGLPDVKSGEKNIWQQAMKTLSSRPNVYCKLSGLLTRCSPEQMHAAYLEPYIMEPIRYFGTQRMLFGSDWPVLTLAADFSVWMSVLEKVLQQLSSSELEDIFYHNAVRVYRL